MWRALVNRFERITEQAVDLAEQEVLEFIHVVGETADLIVQDEIFHIVEAVSADPIAMWRAPVDRLNRDNISIFGISN